MLTLDGHKAIALTSMFLLTFLIFLLPLILRRLLSKYGNPAKTQVVLSGFLCFSAGVLLSMIFLHLLPETREEFEYAMEAGFIQETTYPIAEVVVCAGFFLVYLIEEIAHSCVDHQHSHQQEHNDMQITSDGCKTPEEAKENAKIKRMSQNRNCDAQVSYISKRSYSTSISKIAGYNNSGYEADIESTGQWQSISLSRNTITESLSPVLTKPRSLIGTAVVVAALSFHGLMEGMSVGLENISVDVWILFGALSAHKIFISFSMSTELLEVGVSLKPFLLTAVIFSMASPIGGLIGAIVTTYTAQLDTAAGVLAPAFLQAISGGTILYVTFCEVLERERSKSGYGYVKLFALCLGFSVMAGLEASGGHEHGHHHPSTETTISNMVTASL